MKNKKKDKCYYLWLNSLTGTFELFVSRLKLSNACGVPYYTLNYRFGRLGLHRFRVSEHNEVVKLVIVA